MKIENKFFGIILFLIIFIIPSFAFASWWNPTSWFQKSPTTQLVKIVQPSTSPTVTKSTQYPKKNDTTKNISKKSIAKKTIAINPPVVVENKVPPQTTINPPAPIQVPQQNSVTTTVQPPQLVTPTVIVVPQNTTQCNGATYTLVCPTGEHFFCPTNGEGGKCVSPDANYCNGTAWSTCSSGESFSCTSNGGVCFPIQTQIVPSVSSTPVVVPSTQPTLPVAPTIAQQTTTCQQQYDTSIAPINSSEIQTENLINTAISNDQQTINQLANNGVAFSGAMGQAQQNLTNDQARLASTVDSYNKTIQTFKSILQSCINNIIQK